VDEWQPVERPDRIAGVPSYSEVSRPSIEGRDALAYAMSELVPRKKAVKKRWWNHWPKWLTWKRTVALVAVDLIAAHYAWHYLFTGNPGAARGALLTTMNDAAHHDWNAVYDSLCRSDRAQINEADLANAGNAALAQLGLGLDHATVTSVRPVKHSLGPLTEPQAEQLAGQLYPVVGQPSPYTVVVVHEIPGGWKVCMSAGGFSMLGYTEPLGSSSFTP
jgi:hypothetical protein